MNLGGYPVILSDTAGLRESDDRIEMEGVKRAKARVELSDIKICLLSLSNLNMELGEPGWLKQQKVSIDPIVRQVIDSDTFVLLNKQDMVSGASSLALVGLVERETGARKVWSISCRTGQGLDVFLRDMVQVLKSR
jgi:tRNA modification GTPase